MASKTATRKRPPNLTQAERRALTESRLVNAGLALVAEGGVSAVTTAAVGQRAGYSRGMVNQHFGSRDALMTALAEAAQARFRPNPERLRGRAHVVGVVDAYLETVRSRPDDSRTFLRLWAAAIGDEEPVLRAAFEQRDAVFRSHFEAALAEGVADQTIRADIDTVATAVMLVGLLRGVAMQWQLAPQLVAIDEARAAATRLIDDGLTPAPGERAGQGAPDNSRLSSNR